MASMVAAARYLTVVWLVILVGCSSGTPTTPSPAPEIPLPPVDTTELPNASPPTAPNQPANPTATPAPLPPAVGVPPAPAAPTTPPDPAPIDAPPPLFVEAPPGPPIEPPAVGPDVPPQPSDPSPIPLDHLPIPGEPGAPEPPPVVPLPPNDPPPPAVTPEPDEPSPVIPEPPLIEEPPPNDPPPAAEPPTVPESPPDDAGGPASPAELPHPLTPLPLPAGLTAHFVFDPEQFAASGATPITVLTGQKQPVKIADERDALVSWQDGRFGPAPALTGGYLLADPKLVLPIHNDAERPLRRGTIATWITTHNFYGAGMQSLPLFQTENIVLNGQPTGWDFALFVTAQRHLQFYTKDVSTAAAPPLAVSIRHWAAHESHHVALTWDTNADHSVTYQLFIDGRLQQRQTSVLFPTGKILPKQLSLLSSLRWNVPGSRQATLDQLMTFADALSATQVRQLYAAGTDPNGPLIRAGRAALQLTGPHDGLGVLALRDQQTPTLRKTMQAPPRSLWRLHFQSRTNPSVTFSLANTAAPPETISVQSLGNDELRVAWQAVPLPTADLMLGGTDTVSVAATFTPIGNEHEIRAQLHVQLDATQWQLTDIGFPLIEGLAPPQQDAKTAELVRTGPSIGSLLAQPFSQPLWTYTVNNAPSPAWDFDEPYPSGQVPMPWFGLRDTRTSTGGWYLGVHDPTFSLKRFTLRHVARDTLLPFVDEPALDLVVTTSIPRTPTTTLDYTLPGTAILRVQDGDWFAMAQRYRTFLTTLPALQGRSLTKRAATDLPRWLAHAGVIHTATSYNENHTALIGALADHGVPAEAIAWHYNLWQQGAYFNPPDPQQPGALKQILSQMNDLPHALPGAGFAAGLSKSEAHRIPTLPYTLPVAWDILMDGGQYPQSPAATLWQSAKGEGAALRTSTGAVAMWGNDTYGQFPTYDPLQPAPAGHFVTMCPRAPLWQQQFQQSAVALVQRPGPLSGLYLDVVGRGTPSLCFGTEADHHHAPGDPASYVQGWRELFTKLRAQLAPIVAQKFTSPDDPLARPGFYTEGFSDPYLGVIDGYLMEYMPPWETTVPIAPAVAHDYAVFLGRQTQSKYEPLETMIAKQTQAFSWGMVPGFVTYGLTGTGKFAALRDQLGRLAAARRHRAWQSYLSDGRMLTPPTLRLTTQAPSGVVAQSAAPLAGSDIPLQQLPVSTAATPTVPFPLIAGSAWRQTTATRAALVVASLETASATPQPPTRVLYVPIDRAALGLTGGTSIVTVYAGTELQKELSVPTTGGLRLEVAPQQVYLIEVR